MRRLSRRQFVVGAGRLGLGAAGAVLAAGCALPMPQPANSGKVARIGVLGAGPSASMANNLEPFREGLRELGYVEGQNFVVEYHSPSISGAPLTQLAAELVRLPVDVIVAASTPASLAAKEATSSIPIVMTVVGDPVREGLVASLPRPGGNITGLGMLATTLSAKRLELLKEVVPSASRVVVLWWEPEDPGSALAYHETETAARILGMELHPLRVQGVNWDVDGVFTAANRVGAEAIAVLPMPLVGDQLIRFVTHAAESRLPAMYPFRQHSDAGGLMAYGPNLPALWRRAAYYVDRILKGAKPADLPVEQPMRFDFVVNMRTARELGITFPHEVALQITEVIE
jgi:putative ABC transport system substrate-binding protein